MSRRIWMVCLLLAVLAVGNAGAAEIGLTAVLFPEGKKVEVPLAGTQRAPAAEITAEVEHRGGKSQIEIEYKNLPPAVLFGGDFVSYVVWAVAPGGTVENLGGIANEKDKGTATYSTTTREFALMITAEPLVKVRTAGDAVVFFSGTPAMKKLQLNAFSFGGLSDRDGKVTRTKESIAGLTYKADGKNPIQLIQAEKAIELLDRFDAETYDADGYAKAMATIGEARETKGAKRIDASQRAVEAAATALFKTASMMEDEKKAAAEATATAERQALAGESADLRTNLETTQGSLTVTESKLVQSEAALKNSQMELQRVKASQTSLVKQREALNQQLTGAMGKMATGTKTDRGADQDRHAERRPHYAVPGCGVAVSGSAVAESLRQGRRDSQGVHRVRAASADRVDAAGARREPYDAYSTISFFVSGTGRNETSSSRGADDESGAAVSAADGMGPEVLPLLVTDNMESSLASRSHEQLRELSASLGVTSGAASGGVGGSKSSGRD